MSAKKQAKPAAKADKPNAYAGLGDMMSAGFDEALFSGASEQTIDPKRVRLPKQVRGDDTMEDDEQTLADLGESLKRFQVHAIVVRPDTTGAGFDFECIAGARRVRAAILAGIELRALVKDFSDADAEYIQFAENTQRKNLTQMEEAAQLKRDLDELGSAAAVLAKHHKESAGPAWLSKRLALLTLPAQTARLVKEGISADLEVINDAKQIEKIDPKRAEKLVDELKASRGKGNARKTASAAKEGVKPSKKAKDTKEVKTPKWLEEQRKRDAERAAASTTKATARDRSQEEPSEGETFAHAKSEDPLQVLGNAYNNIFEFGGKPQMILDTMRAEDKEAAEEWLRTHYEAGKQTKDAGRAVVLGFRNGQFAGDGGAALALVAFLQGVDGHASFNMLNVLGAVKS